MTGSAACRLALLLGLPLRIGAAAGAGRPTRHHTRVGQLSSQLQDHRANSSVWMSPLEIGVIEPLLRPVRHLHCLRILPATTWATCAPIAGGDDAGVGQWIQHKMVQPGACVGLCCVLQLSSSQPSCARSLQVRQVLAELACASKALDALNHGLHTGQFYSIEHNATWYDKVWLGCGLPLTHQHWLTSRHFQVTLETADLPGVHTLLSAVPDGTLGWPGGLEGGTYEQFQHFVKAIGQFGVAAFDVILVDGR